MSELQLSRMHERHHALTQAVASSYEEAASVCLSRHHTSPVTLTLSDNGREVFIDVVWVTPDPRVVGAWANTTDTTEAGAYGCVIAGVEHIRGFFAVRRAETGTGADYYVGPTGTGEADLEDCFRLEVSGVDAGDRSEITKRLLAKVRQAKRGESNLPALAGVIGFSAKLLMVRDVSEVT